MRSKLRQTSDVISMTIVAIIISVGYQNCGVAPDAELDSSVSSSEKVTEEEIAGRYQELREIASQDMSCQSSDDCVTIALGAKACGGPSEYAITSAFNDHELIEKLSTELRSIERQYNRDNNLMSDCRLLEEPQVACQANVCVSN